MVRVAAVDCGTNSVRLLVAEVPESGAGQLTELARWMEIVRLGEGVDRTGRLAASAIERTRVALSDFAAEIRRQGARRLRMVATSATRDAANAAEFTEMVKATLGTGPEVVSGDEEARLSYAGAVRGLPAGAGPPYLVVDIGGGSTELVVGRETASEAERQRSRAVKRATTEQVAAARSVDIGCVRMTERHLVGDPPEPAEVAAAEADITEAVDGALAAIGGWRPGTLIGLAGSVTTVAGIALGLPSYQADRIHHSRISYQQVAAVTGDLLRMPRAQRLALPVMHPGRADVIGAGALILRIVMARAGADSVLASEHDILDGIAWSLAPGAGPGRVTAGFAGTPPAGGRNAGGGMADHPLG